MWGVEVLRAERALILRALILIVQYRERIGKYIRHVHQDVSFLLLPRGILQPRE